MLPNKMPKNICITTSTRIFRRTGRPQVRMASNMVVVVLFSCWAALGGMGSSVAATTTTAAPAAGETAANSAQNEFLQSLLVELSKHPGAGYQTFRIVWKREQQQLQQCSTAGSMYCFNRPSIHLTSEQQSQRSGYRVVLVIAAVQQQIHGKPLCEDRTWTAQACVGTYCFNQTLSNFLRCQGDGKTAVVDVTEVLANFAASSTAELLQGEEDGLCVHLISEASDAQARATVSNPEALWDAILLVYSADDKVNGVRAVLSATEMATLGTVTACGRPMSVAVLHPASDDGNSTQQHWSASSTQQAGSDELLSQSPPASHLQDRHARRTPYTGPLGPCSLRPWTISYNDLPNDLPLEKPYFPNVQTVNYCAGSCQSLTPHSSLNFTRHAFMRTRQFGDAVTGILVPQPCCVPVAFWQTSMVYIERNGIMRFEHREDLSVRACGCR